MLNFEKLLLTDEVLDVLGFSQYWSGSGDYGDRTLDFGTPPGNEMLNNRNEYPRYYVRVIDESPGEFYGKGALKKYVSKHFTNKDFKSIHFLHEMYEDVKARRLPEEVEKFEALLDQNNMSYYIEEYNQCLIKPNNRP